MHNFKEICRKYFGSSDFYEILKVPKTASQKEIKKAYHKLSLIVHPDRVDEADKLTANEKFKVLGKIHFILQNEQRRKIYDSGGEFDEGEDIECNWMDYWRNIFKKISIKEIENYEKEYIGSDTEYKDIKQAYEMSKGNMTKMMDFIPFGRPESEPRIIEIVKGMVDRGEVVEYDEFFNEPARKKRQRHMKYQREKDEITEDQMNDLEKNANEIRQRCCDRFVNLLSSLENKYENSKRKAITPDGGSPKKRRSSRRNK
ncbi:J domain-containing protein CG6693-like [Coccinella septempunctata]|uniref:J domain-containing protein CG6693-like n=1 Tax=Coccinella septempunctata TaxID=41139 RepID=UPI001D085587|nr:J domain-containing protein CG6693-like [Coccinella septempunctata]